MENKKIVLLEKTHTPLSDGVHTRTVVKYQFATPSDCMTIEEIATYIGYSMYAYSASDIVRNVGPNNVYTIEWTRYNHCE